MEENKENSLYCSHCGALIGEDEDYEAIDGEIVCTDCVERHTTTCDRLCYRFSVIDNKSFANIRIWESTGLFCIIMEILSIEHLNISCDDLFA